MRVFGHIPGVLVGTHFETRKALAKAHIHRPLQAGISGSGVEGADSIVLSGGYEDDEDQGTEVVYTGFGGRDPATGKQIEDQRLVGGNLALVKSQTEGLPVRLIRGPDPKSAFAPKKGYRYDGLYRVDDSWVDAGRSGFRVWLYRLVRSETIDQPAGDGSVQAPPEAKRRETTVSRIVRDSALGREVKAQYGHACQVCGVKLAGPGGPYAEAAHIRPLGRPHNGPDVLENLLCLCPNHHVLFDLGTFTIEPDLSLKGIEGHLTRKPAHRLDPKHLNYRRDHYAATPGFWGDQ